MINKLKRIKVKTPQGERTLVFSTYKLPTTEGRIPCVDICPYADICDDFPHPEFPDDPTFSFVDFCGSIGVGEDNKEEDLDLIPVKGTIEKNLRDLINPDVFQKLLKEGRLVRIDDVVDSFCSGFCEGYSKDHSNCSTSNPLCLMREVFIKNKVLPKQENKDEEEGEKEPNVDNEQ